MGDDVEALEQRLAEDQLGVEGEVAATEARSPRVDEQRSDLVLLVERVVARQVELERRAVRIVVVDRNRERADVDGIVELSPLDRLRFERRWGRSCADWRRDGRLR